MSDEKENPAEQNADEIKTGSGGENISMEIPKDTVFDHLSALLEAGIFIAEEPINIEQLVKLSGDNPSIIREKIKILMEHYNRYPRGIRLVETGGGYRFETDPTYAPALKKYYKARESSRLTKAAMEALSIIAYKQPITVPEINEIRSVDSGGVIQKLMEKNLIRILGRKKVVGKPLLYGTTKQFLMKFGLNSVEDLPDFEEFLHITGSEIEPDKLKQEFSEHFGPGEEKTEQNEIEQLPETGTENEKPTEPAE